MNVKEFDKLSKKDFENGGIRDEIRHTLSLAERLREESYCLAMLVLRSALYNVSSVREATDNVLLLTTPPKREHNTKSEKCWCDPEIEVLENGNIVIIHRGDQ